MGAKKKQTHVGLCGWLLVLASLAAGCTAFAPPLEVAGTWGGELTWAAGDPFAGFESPLGLRIEQSGTSLTGEIIINGPGSQTISLAIVAGTAASAAFSVDAAATVDIAGTPVFLTITVDGTRTADTLSGTGSQSIDGVIHPFEWSARLSAPETP